MRTSAEDLARFASALFAGRYSRSGRERGRMDSPVARSLRLKVFIPDAFPFEIVRGPLDSRSCGFDMAVVAQPF